MNNKFDCYSCVFTCADICRHPRCTYYLYPIDEITAKPDMQDSVCIYYNKDDTDE